MKKWVSDIKNKIEGLLKTFHDMKVSLSNNVASVSLNWMLKEQGESIWEAACYPNVLWFTSKVIYDLKSHNKC